MIDGLILEMAPHRPTSRRDRLDTGASRVLPGVWTGNRRGERPAAGNDRASLPANDERRDWFDSLDRVLAMDWDRMIPGHPYAGGRLGTKDDVRNLKQYMTELSDAARAAADQGKCWDTAMKEVRLSKYEKWGNYEQHFPGNVERFCSYWGRGY